MCLSISPSLTLPTYLANPGNFLPFIRDMAKIDTTWEIEGMISPAESIEKMMQVITTRTAADTGTFWRWDGKRHPW